MLALASTASADLVLCGSGSGAGQCQGPKGVAVDTASGHVYVADTENNRVDVFDEAGAFLFAFGWKVNAATPEEKLQTCGPAASPPGTACQKGTSGPGPGQLSSPRSIAVDSSSHAVYLAEDSNHRVQKFDSEGHFLWMVGKGVNTGTSGKADLCTNAGAPTDVCKAGTQGFGSGQFNQQAQVAVGPGGTVYVVDSLVSAKDTNHFQKFNPSGELLEPPIELVGAHGDPEGFAVDSSGDLYFGETAYNEGPTVILGGVQKFDPAGHVIAAWGESGKVDPSGNVHAIALDPAGDLFVADQTGAPTEILRYDPSGAESLVFFGAGTLKTPPIALAFHHTATGDLYAAEQGSGANPARVVQLALPEPGPLLVPGSTQASPVGSVKATLKVTFNPEGKASKAHFQYIAKAAYEADGNSFGAGTQTTPDSALTPAGFANQTAAATNTCVIPTEASCLKPETTYYFRAFASNVDGTVTGEKAEFTTLPPLEVKATWSGEVGTDSAALHAEVNPLGIHASAHFEYVDDATFQADKASGDGFQHAEVTAGTLDFGSGEAPLIRAAQLTSLDPGTTYHYRLVASDPFFPPLTSEAHVFTTFAPPAAGPEPCPENQAFRTGPSAALPDCRAYEMVSPLNKENGDILTRANITGLPTNRDQSAAQVPANGLGFTYSSYRAFANPQSAPYTSQLIASRHERGEVEEGWQSEAIDPPRIEQFRLELENEYLAFSEDLSNGWLLQEGEPTLGAPCAPAGFADLYRRASAGGAYQALSCSQPSEQFKSLSNPTQYMPELEGFSADGTKAVFRIDDALVTSKGPAASTATNSDNGTRPVYQVYEAGGAGELGLVSVLPNGEASGDGGVNASAGTALSNEVANHMRFQIVEKAVSSDGARVFWSAGTGASGPLYLRQNPLAEQSAFAHGAASGTGTLSAGSAAVSSLIAAKGKASIESGKSTATLLETSVGRFVAGQPLSGPGIPSGTTILSVAGAILTLSKAAFATVPSDSIASVGPAPFAAGQAIAGKGIPANTTIAAVAPGSLTLSAKATQSGTAVALSASSECTEAAKACTIPVSETVTTEGALFQAGNRQGTEALFTVTAGPLKGNLYRFDSEAKPPASTLIAEKVQFTNGSSVERANILGASEDLSRVYFASEEATPVEEAEGALKGQPNLYLYDAGATRFIGTLSSGGENSDVRNGYGTPIETGPIFRTARVSPDGGSLVFMSNSLGLSGQSAGYDNTDAISGEADAEVYLYDATADAGKGKLRCVSCNPSGARPSGRELQKGIGSWAAAAVPRPTTDLYQPRYVSDDGTRVFFDSFDPLVLGDTNGTEDVYEWEQAGAGGCKEESPTYVPASEGCLRLISSGQSPSDSEFLDASSSGSDAFFTTVEGLLPQDYGLIDIYDARVNGGFPPPPNPPAACEGEACQGPYSPPDDPTPASSSFEGAGNVHEEPLARCAKGKTRRKGRCVAKKHHKRAHRRHAR